MSAARDFYNSGIGHCNVAMIAHFYLKSMNWDRNEATWVALQNNIGFALENALKAYLAAKGITTNGLKNKFGHNLDMLLGEACQRGLSKDALALNEQLVVILRELVLRIGSDYQSFSYRYLNAESVFVIHQGQSTDNAITAIRTLLDLAQRETIASTVAPSPGP